jgi:hypothetical protein
MIEGISAVHSPPTKCHEPSDSTARWGLGSCVAAKIRHSPGAGAELPEPLGANDERELSL